jgi:hypothetical protein
MVALFSTEVMSSGTSKSTYLPAPLGEDAPIWVAEHAVKWGVWDDAPSIISPEIEKPTTPQLAHGLSAIAAKARDLGPENLSTQFRSLTRR